MKLIFKNIYFAITTSKYISVFHINDILNINL